MTLSQHEWECFVIVPLKLLMALVNNNYSTAIKSSTEADNKIKMFTSYQLLICLGN